MVAVDLFVPHVEGILQYNYIHIFLFDLFGRELGFI